MTKEYFV